MARLRLYGDCNSCRDAGITLDGFGASTQWHPTPDATVLQRAINHNPIDKLFHPQYAQASANAAELSRLVSERPESLRAPLVVRGNSFVIGSDPSRVQSLMY
jgi:hypothetical protein